jgi:hypothetical protein
VPITPTRLSALFSIASFTRRIAEINQMFSRQKFAQFANNGQPANT